MDSNSITRRDFLKSVGLAAAAATLSCTTTEVPRPGQTVLPAESPKAEPIVYPPLPGNKIQAPENGCLIGFQKIYAAANDYAAEALAREYASLAERARNNDERKKFQETWLAKNEPIFVQNIKNNLKEYISFFGKKPYTYVLVDTPTLSAGFPEKVSTVVLEEGVVPFIHAKVQANNPKNNMRLEDIVSGKHDKSLINFSKGAAEFGQKHGGFFLYT